LFRSFLSLSLLSLVVVAIGCAEAGSSGDDDDDNDVAKIDSGPKTGSDGGGSGCTDCDPITSNGCQADRCVCNLGPACGDGSTCCPLGCRNLETDLSNCGMCGRPCGANETCTAGECVCSVTGSSCGALDCCNPGGCIDTAIDTDHCGDCTNICTAGDVCTGGSCNCSFTCPAPNPILPGKIVCCGDGCYDVCYDATHCGGCDATTCDSCFLGGCSLDGVGSSGISRGVNSGWRKMPTASAAEMMHSAMTRTRA